MLIPILISYVIILQVFTIFCMLCFFDFHVSATSKYSGNSTLFKGIDEQLEKQPGDGKVKFLLIPFPYDGKHSGKVNEETKTVDLGINARGNEDPAKIMFPGEDGMKYTEVANKDISKILTFLASARNADASDNKGFVPNAAIDGKGGFTRFVMLGNDVFGKRNTAANDYIGNFEGFKEDGRENIPKVGSGEFQAGNGEEVNTEIDYAENFAGFGSKKNGNGFGGDSYRGLIEINKHGQQQRVNTGDFGAFGNRKSFGQSFHGNIEGGKEDWFGLEFERFKQENAKKSEINNYNRGFSGLRSPIVNRFFNARYGNSDFVEGRYLNGLKYHSNENRGFADINNKRFENQKITHCERNIKGSTDETWKANFAGGYNRNNAESSNGKDGFVGKYEYLKNITYKSENMKSKVCREKSGKTAHINQRVT